MKIVLSALLAMFLVACSNENNQTNDEAPAKAVKTETIQVQQQVISKTPKETPITKASEVVQPEKKKVVFVKPKVPEKVVMATSTIDGGKLFTKCVGCHGANAQKSALNKSKIIKGWSVDKVLTALHGYKDGTYGGSMKGVMKSQISNFNEAELKALAEHVSKL